MIEVCRSPEGPPDLCSKSRNRQHPFHLFSFYQKGDAKVFFGRLFIDLDKIFRHHQGKNKRNTYRFPLLSVTQLELLHLDGGVQTVTTALKSCSSHPWRPNACITCGPFMRSNDVLFVDQGAVCCLYGWHRILERNGKME